MLNIHKVGVVLFVYSELGLDLLKIIHNKKIKIHMVITHKNKKRENIWFDSCAEFCKKNGIKSCYFEKTNFNKIYKYLIKFEISCIFSAYFRKIIPEKILELPKNGAVNLHASYLPYYKGRAPVNWQIINGEKFSGGTIHYMNKYADRGNIIYQKKIKINNMMTAYALQKKINKYFKYVLNKNIHKIINGECPSIKQNVNGSYYGKRKPSDGKILWNKKAFDIYNLVRGLSKPYPGAFFIFNSKKIIIEKCSISKIKSRKIKPKYLYIGKNLYIKCKDYYIKVIKLVNSKRIKIKQTS